MSEQKRTCTKCWECKNTKCPHRGKHTETTFCDTPCDTFPEAKCIKI